jgi:IclR family acetate operon transcriptional repressor
VAHSAETGRYRLGLRVLHYGNAVLARLDLREVARAHLRTLTTATGETATLSVAGGGTALTVDFVQSPASVQSVATLGRPSVAQATAVGTVMLAFTDQRPDTPLTAFTDATITDPRRLREEVERTRKRGWADAASEREQDLHAVAVPVRNAEGALLAILGVQGPSWRFGADERRMAVEHLQHAAAQIGATFAGQAR